jgi:regulator of sigma E protease
LATLQTLVAFIFVLGVLVFVHELGHFLAAKRVGIRVLKFQLGFNPTIFSIRRGDTEYGIGALPLGGFVKMAGESPEDERTGSDDEFMSKSKWQRFQVLIMGPAMNLLLAVVLAAVVLYRDGEVPAFESQPPVVGVVTAGSPAEKADIRVGDRILAVGGYSVERWDDFYMRVGARPEREVAIDLVRDGQAMTRRVTPSTATVGRSRFEFGDIGVLPDVHPRLLAVSPNEPGERGGLKAGDVIMAADGMPITFHTDFRAVIAKSPNQPLTLSVLRNGMPLTLSVTPRKNGSIGYLGVTPADEMRRLNPTIVQAVELSVQKNVQSAGLIFQTVWGLITRETSPKQLMGPVAIAQLSGETAQLGWIALANLMAMISLNLGLLNLMPIPVLDGGHIFIMALEGLARRNFSVRVKEKMLLAGFVVLMMLMVTVIYNDLTRISWIERLMPWR